MAVGILIIGIVLVSYSIIVFLTLCLCGISRKEAPKPHRFPEQIHSDRDIPEQEPLQEILAENQPAPERIPA